LEEFACFVPSCADGIRVARWVPPAEHANRAEPLDSRMGAPQIELGGPGNFADLDLQPD